MQSKYYLICFFFVGLFIASMTVAVITKKVRISYFSILGAAIFEVLTVALNLGVPLNSFPKAIPLIVKIALPYILFWTLLFVAIQIPSKNGIGFASLFPKIISIFIWGSYIDPFRDFPYFLGAIIIGFLCLRIKPSRKAKAAMATQSGQQVSDLISNLEKLDACQKAGIISEEEFAAKKAELFK